MKKVLYLNIRGISLLEVMISMLILGFGILGLTPLLVMSVEGNVTARDNSTAASLLKEKVEYFQGLDSLPTVPYSERENGLEGVYARTSRLRDNSSDSLIPAGICQLDVQISWTTHDNRHKTTSYTTYMLK